MSAAHRASLIDRILARRRRTPAHRSVLVAITGIDASGKGHVAGLLRQELLARGLHAAIITVDGWLNLPHVRFSARERAAHFYRHALRLDEMFSRLVLPLRARRSLRLEADYTEETASGYRRRLYEFSELDVILLEGIFLLKRSYQGVFDLSLWLDCTFQTAVQRAVARSQEGLSPEATRMAYETIYFPAQRMHLSLDRPREAARIVHPNDPALLTRSVVSTPPSAPGNC